MALLKFNQSGKTRTWATSNEAEADVIYFCSDGTIVLNKQVCGSYSVEATSGRTSKVGKVKVNGTDITVYEHPTTTAQAAAAKKVGYDDMGHVVLGDSLTKGDVGLSNVDNKSAATLKSEFTGSIADGNTGFVTGDTAYDALALKLDANKRGAANGVASLDSNGKVPATELPSYVDDIIDIIGCYNYYDELYRPLVDGKLKLNPTVSDFTSDTKISPTAEPGTYYMALYHTLGGSNPGIYHYVSGMAWTREYGETGKIYVESSTNKQYRFAEEDYIPHEVVASPGTLDDITEGTINKHFTATEKTKLSGIATGATKTEASSNGKIKINGTDTTVYTPPTVQTTSNGGVRSSDSASDDNYASEKAIRAAIDAKKTAYNDLESNLQGKIDTYDGHITDASDMSPKSRGLYKIAITEQGHISDAEGSAPTAVVKSDLTGLGVEDASNKVTSVDNTSTDAQYPSAKCVYDMMADMASTIEDLVSRIENLEAALTLEKASE